MNYFDNILELFNGSYPDYKLGVGLFITYHEFITIEEGNIILYLVRATEFNHIPYEIRNKYSYSNVNVHDPIYSKLQNHIFSITP